MSTCYFANGVYGIKLSTHFGEQSWYKFFIAQLDAVMQGELSDQDEESLDDCVRRGEKKATKKLLSLFSTLVGKRLKIPEGAEFYWSGSEDERPVGVHDTGAEDWILGFGIFLEPWKYPPIPNSFRKKAELHSWVTAS